MYRPRFARRRNRNGGTSPGSTILEILRKQHKENRPPAWGMADGSRAVIGRSDIRGACLRGAEEVYRAMTLSAEPLGGRASRRAEMFTFHNGVAQREPRPYARLESLILDDSVTDSGLSAVVLPFTGAEVDDEGDHTGKHSRDQK